MLSNALTASFADSSEQRVSDRRLLRLDARVATTAGRGGVQVHNLSRTGLLIESTAQVPIGSQIEVELADGQSHAAQVVWADEGLIGCRFVRTLSQASLSAALLRATPPSLIPLPTITQAEAMAKLERTWAREDAVRTARDGRLSLGKRMWIIGGLALAGWAVPAAAAWMLW